MKYSPYCWTNLKLDESKHIRGNQSQQPIKEQTYTAEGMGHLFCCHFSDTVTTTRVPGRLPAVQNPFVINGLTEQSFAQHSGCLPFDTEDVIRRMTEKAAVSTELS